MLEEDALGFFRAGYSLWRLGGFESCDYSLDYERSELSL